MIKLMTMVAVLLSITFNTSQPQSQTQLPIDSIETLETFEEITVTRENYTLNISLENTNSSHPVLVISMELKNTAHFISPFEKKDLTGKFHFDFGSYKDLAFEGNFTETPAAEAKVRYPNLNPYEENLWVFKNTVYKQPLQIINTGDFEVYGKIQFTIEPSCTFEEIPFAISHKDGKMIFIEPKC